MVQNHHQQQNHQIKIQKHQKVQVVVIVDQVVDQAVDLIVVAVAIVMELVLPWPIIIHQMDYQYVLVVVKIVARIYRSSNGRKYGTSSTSCSGNNSNSSSGGSSRRKSSKFSKIKK